MKIVKLLSIFVGVLLVLLGAIYIPKFFDSSDDDFGDEDLVDITELCESIRSQWEKSVGWNQKLYSDIRSDIDQSKGMGMFTLSGYNTVNNTLRESSINAVNKAYMAALHNRNFSEDALVKQYNGIQYLMKAEKMEKDSRVVEVLNRHSLYTKIKSFVNSSHSIYPKYDTKTNSWKSFESQQNAILSTARSYRDNTLYSKEMSHIPGFQSGLSESSLKSEIGNNRPSFYKTLSSQIIDHFTTLEKTQENVNLLNHVYEEFDKQEKKYGNDTLIDFMLNYQVDPNK